ncbi:MAG: hypothetical protein IKZ82_13265 [Clostridia bacterium]|nr:hypothetical protein [Clostridia bacterium]
MTAPDKEAVRIKYEENLLKAFAKALAPGIKAFFQSDEGKLWYEEWLKEHPEYDK